MLHLFLLTTALALTPEDAQAILQIEALRLPPLAVEEYVRSENIDTRARAARALGRLRTRAAVGLLRGLARDEAAVVRAEAAFALGQIPDTGSLLLELLREERDELATSTLLEALGKQGGAEAIPALLDALALRPELLQRPRAAEAAAIALGRLGMRGVDGAAGPVVTGALLRTLARFDRDVRRGAAFALGRIGAARLPDDQRASLLRAALEDRDPVVRAFLIRATTPLEMDTAARAAVYARAAADPDAGVRVAVARAAASTGWAGVTALLSDLDMGVRLEAIAATGKQEGLDHVALLLPVLRAGSTLEAAEAARARGDSREVLAAAALSALAAAEALPETGEDSLERLLDPARPTRIRAAAAGALDDRDALVRLAVSDGEPAVRTSAVSRLVELEPSTAQVLALFDSFDAMIVSVAAEHMSKHPDAGAERRLIDALATAETDELDLMVQAMKALDALYDEARPMVRKPAPEAAGVVGPLLEHPDPHVYEAAASLARKLGLPPPPYKHRLFPVDLEEVARLRSARLQTTRGEVILTLDPENAPLTVWNFASLADKGYFDGLAFHRVVPDFVVQDGDPRGDGWGGPGYTIPDEIGPGHYREGSLGMALSGPDTGGSQWFVTLSPQPHLDGGYTRFGEVSQGMQVLRAMLPGDRILRITIERSQPPAY